MARVINHYLKSMHKGTVSDNAAEKYRDPDDDGGDEGGSGGVAMHPMTNFQPFGSGMNDQRPDGSGPRQTNSESQQVASAELQNTLTNTPGAKPEKSFNPKPTPAGG